MRELDKQEAPSIGRKIEKPAEPTQNQRVREGVYKTPDGKLYTDIPTPPPAPGPTIWDIYIAGQHSRGLG